MCHDLVFVFVSQPLVAGCTIVDKPRPLQVGSAGGNVKYIFSSSYHADVCSSINFPDKFVF